MNGDIELTPEAEAHGDWLREEAIFARQCPARDKGGVRCTFTLHLNGHSWEVTRAVLTPPHDHVNPDGTEQTPRSPNG